MTGRDKNSKLKQFMPFCLGIYIIYEVTNHVVTLTCGKYCAISNIIKTRKAIASNAFYEYLSLVKCS